MVSITWMTVRVRTRLGAREDGEIRARHNQGERALEAVPVEHEVVVAVTVCRSWRAAEGLHVMPLGWLKLSCLVLRSPPMPPPQKQAARPGNRRLSRSVRGSERKVF